jgi:hypothetical protein
MDNAWNLNEEIGLGVCALKLITILLNESFLSYFINIDYTRVYITALFSKCFVDFGLIK